MTTTDAGTRSATRPATDAADDTARGWYLYGITRRGALAPVLAELDAGRPAHTGAASVPDDGALLELIECSGLAAVVRPVRLADFSMVVLEERLRDASGLEAMVRAHNRVIDAVHARQAILPAKFGVVYSNARDIVSALRTACDTLLPRLHRLEGCDEWALHLCADRGILRERVAARTPELARLRDEMAAARPGRAYFLGRLFNERIEDATRHARVALAQGAFDRLARFAVDAQLTPIGKDVEAAQEVEILRAAFLVARDAIDRFEAELVSVADANEGLRCECSGPWAPYSFAVRGGEVAE